MKRFIEGEDRGQTTLLPDSLEDYVTADNPVRVVDAAAYREAPVGEASSGNLALSCGVGNPASCGVGNPAGLRGLPDGAEGIRTSDHRGACARAR
jgi:hypothetical protein